MTIRHNGKNIMSPAKTLNESTFKERELVIINSAILVVAQEGIENITMDKVIAQVSFSKGTVYKHFISKEDLLLAISNHAMTMLNNFFMRAYKFDGTSRSRMLLLNFSYLIYAMLYPILFQTVLCAKSPSVLGKSSQKRINEMDQLETRLMKSIHGIVEDGLKDKSLSLTHSMTIEQLCFSNWSTAYGVITLLSDDIKQCSGRVTLIIERELFNVSNMLYDGMQWQPLTQDINYCTELKEALSCLFPDELEKINAQGRELIFT